MNAAYPKYWFYCVGLVSFLETQQRITSASRTTRCRTVRAVVWEDGGSYPASCPMLKRYTCRDMRCFSILHCADIQCATAGEIVGAFQGAAIAGYGTDRYAGRCIDISYVDISDKSNPRIRGSCPFAACIKR